MGSHDGMRSFRWIALIRSLLRIGFLMPCSLKESMRRTSMVMKACTSKSPYPRAIVVTGAINLASHTIEPWSRQIVSPGKTYVPSTKTCVTCGRLPWSLMPNAFLRYLCMVCAPITLGRCIGTNLLQGAAKVSMTVGI